MRAGVNGGDIRRGRLRDRLLLGLVLILLGISTKASGLKKLDRLESRVFRISQCGMSLMCGEWTNNRGGGVYGNAFTRFILPHHEVTNQLSIGNSALKSAKMLVNTRTKDKTKIRDSAEYIMESWHTSDSSMERVYFPHH